MCATSPRRTRARSIDRPRVGLLFDRLDPAALARTLLEAIDLSELPETAALCRARAEELSVDRCAESYLDLHRQTGAG
ncbi:MAG: hypothetical protein M3071_10645 [Actinomycetota bacterium]|nr:hypothetical protein [Actinomycetota bacterium]